MSRRKEDAVGAGRRQKQVRWAVGLVIVALAAHFVFLIVTGTVEYRAYLREHRPFVPHQPFPLPAVVLSSALLLAEALALWRFLTGRWSTLVARALVAFAVFLGGALVLAAFLHMHSPPYVTNHLLWLLYAAGLALVSVVVLAGWFVVRRAARGGGGPPANRPAVATESPS